MISYLASTLRPNILFTMYQCTRYYLSLKRLYDKAVKQIGRYLKCIKDKGIIYYFNVTKDIDIFIDADFASSQILSNSYNSASALLRIGYIIKVVNYSTYQISKIQMEVVLSIIEAEHIILFQSTRDLMLIKNLVKYLNQFVKFNNADINTCSVLFKDNNGVL